MVGRRGRLLRRKVRGHPRGLRKDLLAEIPRQGEVLAHPRQECLVTIIALHFGTLFSGALVVETIFAYLGTGKLIYDSIMGNDFNLALAGLLFATLVTLVSNVLADLAYAWLDPRITYGD